MTQQTHQDNRSMPYQVLARKWRPRRFEEMVGQEHVLRALTNALNSGRVHHAFLFTGTRGVGKTTVARILAKSLNCETGVSALPCGTCAACTAIDEGRFVDLIEVDAASRTKVEDTRDLLDNVQYAPTRGRYKVYLIDEVHMLSNHSFNALLKTLEEPPAHVKFLFATTDPQKLPVTILSRCLQFNLKRLYPDLIREQLAAILGHEQIEFDDGALKRLAVAADGSMRDALSLMDQAIAYGAGRVTDADVREMLGHIEQTEITTLLSAIAQRDVTKLQAALRRLNERAPDYADALSAILAILHHVAMLQQLPDAYDDAMGDRQILQILAQQLAPEDVQVLYQIGLVGQRDLAYAPSALLGFQMTVLRMLSFMPVDAQAGEPTAPVHSGGTTPPVSTTTQLSRSANDVPTAAVLETATPNTSSNEWLDVINRLKLTGMVREMALHSVVTSMDETSVHLQLDPACKNLLTEERRQGLQVALQTHLNRPVRLNIVIADSSQFTPAAQLKREHQQRREAAQAAIGNDTNVQKIIETFSAQIKPNSVQPID